MELFSDRILDCTLRDGSYANNFEFTADQTSTIVSRLEFSGINWIEVGHGVGLGASSEKYGIAAESDEAYMAATASAVKDSKWGMFCIPGIADLSDLERAGDYDMDFVRLGINPGDLYKAEKFIDKAKSLGMVVCLNFMKSYTVSPDLFSNYVREATESGADITYLVDSAGGMMPNEIFEYYNTIANDVPEAKMGFHGHNNLGLSVANSLIALENGAVMVDVSLKGMGRSAGNTPSEQLISAMLRSGYTIDIDPVVIADAGEELIVPIYSESETGSLDIVSGFALFHSSYMPIIEDFSTKYSVDPRYLIIEVCKEDKVNLSIELVERKAKLLLAMGASGRWKSSYKHYFGKEQL